MKEWAINSRKVSVHILESIAGWAVESNDPSIMFKIVSSDVCSGLMFPIFCKSNTYFSPGASKWIRIMQNYNVQ